MIQQILRDSEIRAQNYHDKPYKVTTIVSSYKSEAFMRDCLHDLAHQTIFSDIEVIVLDAASPENERAIVADFQRHHSNVRYIRTPERIGIYSAWNIMIELAQGQYITPFSTNDRLRREAYEILSRALDEHQDVSLVYGDTLVTRTPHETFDHNSAHDAWRWPTYSYEDLLLHCRVGPHPMWRRQIHDDIGYFDDTFVALGDQEFWCRMGASYKLLHIAELTGLVWVTEHSLSGNKKLAAKEARRLRRRHNSFWRRFGRTLLNKLF